MDGIARFCADTGMTPEQLRTYIETRTKVRGLPLDQRDDATQEVLVRIEYRYPAGIAHPIAWLQTVAARICIDFHRVRHDDDDVAEREIADSAPTVLQILTEADESILNHLRRNLDEEDKKLTQYRSLSSFQHLFQYYVKDVKVEELAAMCGAEVGTCRKEHLPAIRARAGSLLLQYLRTKLTTGDYMHLYLRFVDRLSYAQIARWCGAELETCKNAHFSKIARAALHLLQEWRDVRDA